MLLPKHSVRTYDLALQTLVSTFWNHNGNAEYPEYIWMDAYMSIKLFCDDSYVVKTEKPRVCAIIITWNGISRLPTLSLPPKSRNVRGVSCDCGNMWLYQRADPTAQQQRTGVGNLFVLALLCIIVRGKQ